MGQRTSPGQLVREARTRVDLDQAELAVMLDVSPETISRWETGAVKMPGYALVAALSAMAWASIPHHKRAELHEFAPCFKLLAHVLRDRAKRR